MVSQSIMPRLEPHLDAAADWLVSALSDSIKLMQQAFAAVEDCLQRLLDLWKQFPDTINRAIQAVFDIVGALVVQVASATEAAGEHIEAALEKVSPYLQPLIAVLETSLRPIMKAADAFVDVTLKVAVPVAKVVAVPVAKLVANLVREAASFVKWLWR